PQARSQVGFRVAWESLPLNSGRSDTLDSSPEQMTDSRHEHDQEADEEALGRLLAALPPPPDGWVEAAASLPEARRDADRLLALVEEDGEFRAAAITDLEGALGGAGYAPPPPLLAVIRMRLEAG